MKAARHPQVSAIHGTTRGVTIAPMFEPALNIPVANARSRTGNHSATVLIDAGKFPDSPTPSAKRATPKPVTVRASACAIAARLQTTIDAANPSRVPISSISRPAPR